MTYNKIAKMPSGCLKIGNGIFYHWNTEIHYTKAVNNNISRVSERWRNGYLEGLNGLWRTCALNAEIFMIRISHKRFLGILLWFRKVNKFRDNKSV